MVPPKGLYRLLDVHFVDLIVRPTMDLVNEAIFVVKVPRSPLAAAMAIPTALSEASTSTRISKRRASQASLQQIQVDEGLGAQVLAQSRSVRYHEAQTLPIGPSRTLVQVVYP